MRARPSATILVVVVLLVAACAGSPDPVVPDDLADRVGIDAVYGHLAELQDIADEHDGNRADGSPGFQGSVEYVANTLREHGFDVETSEFQRLSGAVGGDPALTVSGRAHRVDQASLLVTTPPGGLRAITLRPPRFAGCAAADYGTMTVKGAIAVVDDTGCSIVDKQNVALARGAVGMLVVSEASPARPTGAPAGLFPPSYYRQLTLPVGIIDTEADAALRRTSAQVRLELDNEPVMTTSRNVVAQTKTGDPRNVVMVGAHLDSVRSGPGINDNGSGVAAVLETATQLGARPQVANAVRFAFWGAEEIGLEGSRNYLRSLDEGQLADIAMYLNVDVIGSPNAGYFTDDGDESAQAAPRPVPPGSAGIERTLAARLNTAGVRPADIPLGRTTDYAPFMVAGIPIGGVTTGSSQRKTEVQQRLWGGRDGVAFDPNYHTPRDTLDNIDRDALAVMASTVAFATGFYAQQIGGVNGVPARDQRDHRTP